MQAFFSLLWLVAFVFGVPIMFRVCLVKGVFGYVGSAFLAVWHWLDEHFLPVLLLGLCCYGLLGPGAVRSFASSPTVTISPTIDTGNKLSISYTITAGSGENVSYSVLFTNQNGGGFDQQYIIKNDQGLSVESGTLTADDLGHLGPGVYQIVINVVDVDGTVHSWNDIGASANCVIGGSSSGTSSYNGAPSIQSKPGDLQIGIPHLGSIKIPSGWLTDIFSYAQQIAAAYTGMTSGSLSTSFNNMLDHQLGLSASGTADVNTMLQKAEHDLFAPDPAGADAMKAHVSEFVNWGPSHYVQNFSSVFSASNSTPAPPNTHTDLAQVLSGHDIHSQAFGRVQALGPVSRDSRWSGLRPALAPMDDTNGTGSGAPMAGTIGIPLLTVDTNTGTWSDTGTQVPFDFSPVTNSPIFGYIRGLLGGAVYLVFVWVIFSKTVPKPTY